MTQEQIIAWLPILTAFLLSLPGVYAIYRQLKMERLEKKKLIIEAEAISADIAAKFIESAGNIQDFYAEILEEVKKQLVESREAVDRLEQKVDNLSEENRELKIVVEKQNKKIEELETGVCTLVEQVKELGQEPRYPKERNNAG
jgi:methyl-accepting chemotaxis protein